MIVVGLIVPDADHYGQPMFRPSLVRWPSGEVEYAYPPQASRARATELVVEGLRELVNPDRPIALT